MGKYVIGIDIGGTNFRIGAVSKQREVQFFQKFSVTDIFSTSNALEDLGSFLEKYLENELLQGHVLAISIGFPATINKERTVVLQAPNVRFMEKLPVVEYLQKRLEIPVFIERDVCMTLFYDKDFYQIPDERVLAGCYFGTGIGNAICVDGKMLLGKNGVSGELGHIKVQGNEAVCGCGNRGCMENLAGGKYLAKMCEEVFTETDVKDIFTKHGTDTRLKEFVERMAICVSTEINILDPNYILVGGGVPNMNGFPIQYLEEKIHEYTRKPYPEQDLNLIFVGDDKTKSVLGAAVYGWKRLEGMG